LRTLVLSTDAFGGYGGIAMHNRDVLSALCAQAQCTEVVAIPRLIPRATEPLPPKLTYVTTANNNKAKYVASVLQVMLRNRAFDLIVCGHINLLPMAFLAKEVTGAPLVLEMHGVEVWRPTNKPWVNYLAKRIDNFISVSELTRDRFVSWTHLDPRKGHILFNAVHTERFGPGDKSPELVRRYRLEGRTVIMTLGRLVSHERFKGFDEVLALIPELAKEIPSIAYVIGGDGDDRTRLQDEAWRLGIEDRVVFTGFIPEREKADHYRLADAYVMASRGEGFGIVTLEAMACGVPVVASSIDGGREAVRNGELGILVDPRNPTQVKEGILAALRRPNGVVPPGLDFFSFENFTQRLYTIIEACVQSPRTEG
jgi:phosphatidylinositol alpha-1,6-mannosyltransferase